MFVFCVSELSFNLIFWHFLCLEFCLFVCLFLKRFGWIELGPNSHAQIIWKYGLLPAPQYSFLQSDGIKNRIHNHKGCTWRTAVILHATQINCIFWWCGCFGFNCTGRLCYFSGFTWLFQPFITVSFLSQWLNDPGGGVLPYRSYIGHVPPHRVGFLRRFGLKTGIDFAHFGLESGMVFEGTTGVYERIYRFNSKWVRKKEKYANLKWIWIIFLFALKSK